VWALAVRLQDKVLVAWAVAVVVFGVLIGSLVNSVADFLSSPVAREWIEKLGGAQILTDAFLASEIGIMGILVAAYGVGAANRLRGEEIAGHTEALLGTATTRARWATSHFAVALAGVAILMLLTGLSVGIGAAAAMHDSSQVGRITLAGLAQVPAEWVIVGVVLAVFGWAPRLTGAVWGVLFAFIALGEFGVLWNAPQWLMNLSPFQHSPGLPVGTDDLAALGILTAVAGAFAAVGYLGWRRRDLAP
jgi:ABC-2 type transport system permease protein